MTRLLFQQNISSRCIRSCSWRKCAPIHCEMVWRASDKPTEQRPNADAESWATRRHRSAPIRHLAIEFKFPTAKCTFRTIWIRFSCEFERWKVNHSAVNRQASNLDATDVLGAARNFQPENFVWLMSQFQTCGTKNRRKKPSFLSHSFLFHWSLRRNCILELFVSLDYANRRDNDYNSHQLFSYSTGLPRDYIVPINHSGWIM